MVYHPWFWLLFFLILIVVPLISEDEVMNVFEGEREKLTVLRNP